MTDATKSAPPIGHQMIAQPALPGVSNDRVAAIFATLCAEFVPTDLLETWWLNDVAHLTARIEHLRLAVRGFYRRRMKSMISDFYTSDVKFDEDGMARAEALCDSDFSLRAEPDAQTAAVLERLMGLVLAEDNASIRVFDDLERGLLRERDRVFAQFEKRRRQKVIEVVAAVEAPKGALLPARTE